MRAKALALSAAAASLFTMTGCQDIFQAIAERIAGAVGGSGSIVDYPGGDRTSPTAELRYYGKDGRLVTLGEGDESIEIEVDEGDIFFVFAVAEDPETGASPVLPQASRGGCRRASSRPMASASSTRRSNERRATPGMAATSWRTPFPGTTNKGSMKA